MPVVAGPGGAGGAEAAGPVNERSEPFWNSKGFVAFLAMVPAVATAFVTWLNADGALRVAREEHAHTIRMDYFSRAIDPANDAEYRARVLRFLRHSVDDDALREWAEEELSTVAPEVEVEREARARIRALTMELRDAEARGAAETAEERERRERAERELEDLRSTRADVSACRDAFRECEACRDARDEQNDAARAAMRDALSAVLEIDDSARRSTVVASALSRTLPSMSPAINCLVSCRAAQIRCGVD